MWTPHGREQSFKWKSSACARARHPGLRGAADLAAVAQQRVVPAPPASSALGGGAAAHFLRPAL
eukprot:scaffold840_cov265-Pinguiococcus_pyrenoidosus.AAC.16